MKIFAVTGTSGVGKSHLEKELELNHGFHRMITYTDRERRAEEKNDPARVCLSKDEYQQMKSDFIFELQYTGNNYGWRKDEFLKFEKLTNVIFVVTLEAMTRIVKDIPGIIPILLHIKPENFSLIEARMKKRMGYAELVTRNSEFEIREIEKKVKERLELATKEVNEIRKYMDVVKQYNGQIFEIKDDKSLYQEVIPMILKFTN
ncbi:MAG: hypothetical protein WCJ58_02665 [bacterium]